MKRKNFSILFTLVLVAVMVLSFGPVLASAAIISFSEDFEAATINSFWTVREEFGTVQLSTEQAYSGSQSAKYSSISGGNKNISLIHDFPDLLKGTASVWLYDTEAGSNTLYASMFARDGAVGGDKFRVLVLDHDPSWYYVQKLGENPIKTRQRTVGWHQFEIVFGSVDVQVFIDGNQVASFPGDYSFDRVGFGVFGPSGNPNATFYWDDFNVEVCPAGVTEVSIDIKPGSDPNSINLKSNGVIPVAVLTDGSFDAASVNPTTVLFGQTGYEAGPVHYSFDDVDDDGDTDMILHFRTQDTSIEPDDTEATLTGQTTDDIEITGTDSVRIVAPEGKGKANKGSNSGNGGGQDNGNDNPNSGPGNNQGGENGDSNPGQGKGKGKSKK